jgi:PhnB protein
MEQARTISDSEGVSLKIKKKPGPSSARTDFLIINQPKERTMQINAYLNFNGQCEAAFKFYERCLGGKIEAMLPHAGTQAEEHVAPEWRNKILHARLIVGDDVLMGSDAPPDRYEAPKGFSVTLQIADPADAERIFHALAENGIVQMPIQQTFWTARFGMLVDQFGIPWMVNCEKAA